MQGHYEGLPCPHQPQFAAKSLEEGRERILKTITIGGAVKAEAELPALREENDIQRAGIQELSRQLAEAQDEYYATTERLWQWARENLTGDIAEQFWQIAANGHLMQEQPKYHQRINMLRHKAQIFGAEVERLTTLSAGMLRKGGELQAENAKLRKVVEAAKEAFKEIDIRTHTHSLDMGGNPGITMRVKQGDERYWQAVWDYNKAVSELDREGEK